MPPIFAFCWSDSRYSTGQYLTSLRSYTDPKTFVPLQQVDTYVDDHGGIFSRPRRIGGLPFSKATLFEINRRFSLPSEWLEITGRKNGCFVAFPDREDDEKESRIGNIWPHYQSGRLLISHGRIRHSDSPFNSNQVCSCYFLQHCESENYWDLPIYLSNPPAAIPEASGKQNIGDAASTPIARTPVAAIYGYNGGIWRHTGRQHLPSGERYRLDGLLSVSVSDNSQTASR